MIMKDYESLEAALKTLELRRTMGVRVAINEVDVDNVLRILIEAELERAKNED